MRISNSGGGDSGKFRTEVPKSSMRSSNLGVGALQKLRTKVPKSDEKFQILWGGGYSGVAQTQSFCNLVPGNQLGANLDLSNCRLLYREMKLNYGTFDPRNG